ncbi:MAG: endonuclease Q family protein [Planctomycetota bacterium]|jgi:PHP family Zn ribbon phosphoesterase
MHLAVDLHSHSGHAGGVGDIRLEDIASAMQHKGIDVFGSGDCLHSEWRAHLKEALREAEPGFFSLNGFDNSGRAVRFVLQTEIIITAAVPGRKGRNAPHTVILFPSFDAAESVEKLLAEWGVKLSIGRPFLKCKDSSEVADRVNFILDVDKHIEMIPAHVMTPQGIYGCEPHLDSMEEFFAGATERLHAVETGLSADPVLLGMIPELDDILLVSNSDCHSGASHRLGREFTTLDVDERSFGAIIEAIRKRKVVRTAEFNPAEGRYFLTGHRGDKKGHNGVACCFSPDFTPEDRRCPICGKRLTMGVLERTLGLSRIQGGSDRKLGPGAARQDYIHTVPLSEICAYNHRVSNPASKKALAQYGKIVEVFGTEIHFWERGISEVEMALSGIVPDEHLANILEIKRGNFTFEPLGFDGYYGKLVIGKTADWFSTNCAVGL